MKKLSFSLITLCLISAVGFAEDDKLSLANLTKLNSELYSVLAQVKFLHPDGPKSKQELVKRTLAEYKEAYKDKLAGFKETQLKQLEQEVAEVAEHNSGALLSLDLNSDLMKKLSENDKDDLRFIISIKDQVYTGLVPAKNLKILKVKGEAIAISAKVVAEIKGKSATTTLAFDIVKEPFNNKDAALQVRSKPATIQQFEKEAVTIELKPFSVSPELLVNFKKQLEGTTALMKKVLVDDDFASVSNSKEEAAAIKNKILAVAKALEKMPNK